MFGFSKKEKENLKTKKLEEFQLMLQPYERDENGYHKIAKESEILEQPKEPKIEIEIEKLIPKYPVIIQGFKAFNSDMTCRDYQYEENKLFTYNGEIEICNKGFHFCKSLIDCFVYYPLNSNTIICRVESRGNVQDGTNFKGHPYMILGAYGSHSSNNDLNSKIVTNKLYIKDKISKEAMLEYILNNKYSASYDFKLLTLVENSLINKYWDEHIIAKVARDLSFTLFCKDTYESFIDGGFTEEQSFELLKIRCAKNNF